MGNVNSVTYTDFYVYVLLSTYLSFSSTMLFNVRYGIIEADP
jgi:hypothetical protein